MTRALHDIGSAVKRLQMRHHRAIDAALRPHGLSLVQWDALRHLDEHPGASLHDLARLTFQSDQAAGTLAGRMIEHGLIERIPGPGRAVRHHLTEKGRSVRGSGDRIVDGVLADSFAALSASQLADFDELLLKLLDLGAVTRVSPVNDRRRSRSPGQEPSSNPRRR